MLAVLVYPHVFVPPVGVKPLTLFLLPFYCHSTYIKCWAKIQV